MSAEDLYQSTTFVTHEVKLFGSEEKIVIRLRPGGTVFDLKESILAATNWFEGQVPSRLSIWEDDRAGKVDSPTLLLKDNKLVVRLVPAGSISIRVSDDRGTVSHPWLRPNFTPDSLNTLIPENATTLYIIDSSVLKSVLLGERAGLPVRPELAYVVGKKATAEKNADHRTKQKFLPYVANGSGLIKGFTQDRETTLFRMFYKSQLQGKTHIINGRERTFPEYEQFEEEDDYPNTCNNFVIICEAALIARYISKYRRRAITTKFLTFDLAQGYIAENLKTNGRAILELLVEPTDVQNFSIVTTSAAAFQ